VSYVEGEKKVSRRRLFRNCVAAVVGLIAWAENIIFKLDVII